ncbi:YhgE/Pip domain-containing protein [Paenibacillus eucommiae]|uniref:YhgE/Pip-like protein n=1 Tax=Paenibacillus eucommiae TaxID=1355755 RepID=A0ABS4JBD3_9BACL|nr:ABC transporter permease [Paenibacillus eucommiae]MBP1996044.1 YhgE/Pip-like protein [Paenibacillus eucommiae]
MAIFKQKMLWLGIVVVMVALVAFGAAMMGSVLGTKPKELPVALVMLDQAVELPAGGKLAAGEMMKGRLTENTQLPIVWEIVGSEEEARAGHDKHKYYGALVLPADLSSGLLSLSSPNPKPAVVTIIANEGMNTQAATVVKQVLSQVMKGVSLELSNQMIGQLGQQTGQIPAGAAASLLAPITIQEEIVHPVGVNNASGNAPGLLTQIIWIGSLITGMILFITNGKALMAGANRWTVMVSQTAAGLVIVGAAAGFLLWMASSWYGMELAHAVDTWLFLWLTGSVFFLLQSALLNWIGLPSMGILVLLMFFSMPVLNMAPEFLSQTTQDWIYSWTPLRFAASGLREVMYFGGLDSVSSNASVLWTIGGAFLALLLASGVKKTKTNPEKLGTVGVASNMVN